MFLESEWGIKIYLNDSIGSYNRIQNKRHKRKSNRRWQKKYAKRFGYTFIPIPLLQNGQVLRVGEDKLYMNSSTYNELEHIWKSR